LGDALTRRGKTWRHWWVWDWNLDKVNRPLNFITLRKWTLPEFQIEPPRLNTERWRVRGLRWKSKRRDDMEGLRLFWKHASSRHYADSPKPSKVQKLHRFPRLQFPYFKQSIAALSSFKIRSISCLARFVPPLHFSGAQCHPTALMK